MDTNLSEKKLKHFREILLEMKAETEKHLKTHDRKGPNEATQELADYGNHPADIGTEQFEQQRDAGLEQSHREHLEEIDAALKRIENKTYGFSEKSGKPIPEERLEIIPTATMLVEEDKE